ncbi:synembryn-A [Neodiprion virginianus]|uniref:synembryn-A n=1 Tax=Neodiprion fabricii TaxID=2872261 RepID=UPI001ED8D484|nr:synembryn-A [Neodiprion fabricii]XP_046625372.1 synembryn-A [Neodiprion virginianus]
MIQNMGVVKFDIFSGSSDELTQNLSQFIAEHETQRNFTELNENNLRNRIWTQLFDTLNNEEYKSTHQLCLSALRLLSRDKTDIDELVTESRIATLLRFAYLDTNLDNENVASNSETVVETLKVLCNLIYNSQQARTLVIQTSSCLSQTVQRLSKQRSELTHEGRLFHLRLLFLVTALCINTRSKVKTELNAEVHLIEMLEETSEQLRNRPQSVLKVNDHAIACEVLKVLFNLYIRAEDEQTEEEKNEKLVSILYELLICETIENQDELISHAVNLLTVVPINSYSTLIPPVQSDNVKLVYHNMDMRAVSTLLKFLNKRLDSETDLTENISPIATVLIRLARAQRLARKYIRLQILPPLKDVMKRPEEGITLRAKLCKQLTNPQTDLRDLVAELIFILCKESVARMVKYTGYGNAAGMFANKGLLGGRQPKTNYSSESEDSDTDEYIKYKEQINPITGCYESPKPNPLEGMSEERKEYEAVQLANLMDKLTREGIVQPCRIGEDGKPKPIEHVLELQNDSK